MTDERIPVIPNLPSEVKAAIDNKQLAVFIGAGASAIIGCDNWRRLAENLVEKCFETPKLDDKNQKCINYKVRESLLQINDPKKIITICKYILEKNVNRDEFFDIVKQSLEPKSKHSRFNFYNELYGLRGLFITTNIDEHFDKLFNKSQIVCRRGSFTLKNIDPAKLYHIHGSISEDITVILTVKEYLDRYSNDADFQRFLQEIFSSKVVLFVGYGLNEYEVLDFLITKTGMSIPEKPRHFILRSYYSGEETLLEFDEHYFSQLGVRVIAFNKDESGNNQLYEIIRKWKTEISQTTQFLIHTFEDIKKAANNYDPSDRDQILQLITEGSMRQEFFKQLSQSADPAPWLGPLKNNGYFVPKNYEVATPAYYDFLSQLAALENAAKINSVTPLKETTDTIVEIINSLIDYRDENGKRFENDWIDRYVVRIIFLLELDLIEDYYFNHVRMCLESNYDPLLISGEIEETLFPKLIENNAKTQILKILNIIFEFKKCVPPKFELYTTLIDHYYLEEIVKKYTEDVIRICGLEAVCVALEKVEAVLKVDSTQFHEIWIPSIDENDKEDRDDSQLVHFIWSGFSILGPTQIRQKINELLQKDPPIFRRIGICAIDHNYRELKNLFWGLTYNPLQEYHTETEVYELLKNHCHEFSKDEIHKTITWIETKNYHEDRLSRNPKETELYLAREKKGWLSAILESDDPDVKKSFAEYHAIFSGEVKPREKRITGPYLIKDASPITKEHFLQKSNADIILFLNTFREDSSGSSILSSRALCDVFRQSIIENPKRFVNDLVSFLELKRSYQYGLLIGLTEAWRAEKAFEWDNIFDFLNAVIESDTFWTEVYEEDKSNYRNWIVSQIADLIEVGTAKDNHLFNLALLPKAEKILLVLAKRSDEPLFDMGDLSNSVLNSSKGKIYSAMINYSLCYVRHYRKDSESRFSELIKEDFTRRLDPQIEHSVEFSLSLGKFLTNLCYLDKHWVRENINRIFPKEDENHWKSAFTGYLSYSNTVYVKIYSLLRLNGHYLKALNTEFKDPHVTEHLVQHICIGYMEGLENLNDETSLINQILSNWNPKHVIELIRFLKWFNKDSTPDKKEKIIALWRIIISKGSSDLENADNIEILSELNDWISLIDVLNGETQGWLVCSAKYVSSHDFTFIDQLIKHAEITPKYAGEIFLSMLSGGHFFHYNKEKIIQFVTILFGKKEETAVRICNRYLEAGFDFLVPLQKENLEK